jgi:hypothetical protein
MIRFCVFIVGNPVFTLNEELKMVARTESKQINILIFSLGCKFRLKQELLIVRLGSNNKPEKSYNDDLA